MTTTLEEKATKFIEANKIQFKSGKREAFFSDLKKSVQETREGFRTTRGQKIDLESYLASMLETSLYSARPSAKENYLPAYPIRNEATKSAHKKLTRATLQKALNHENVILNPAVSEKIIDLLSENFLVADTDDGLAFFKIHDSPVGSIPGKEIYNLEQLLNVTGSARHIDAESTRIGKLQHKAALRQAASGMVEPGSKPAEINKLTEDLLSFERRSLRSGMKLPQQIDKGRITDEFMKKAELEGSERSSAMAIARSGISAIDDTQPISLAVSKIEIPNTQKDYTF